VAYWRMQVHPNDPSLALAHSIESLAAGFIGLDFATEVGDLMQAEQSQLPDGQKDYWAFAHDMRLQDKVLVIVHHFPFALATVVGEYNYIRNPEPELGVWFRHFRRVAGVRYYGDFKTNAHNWPQLIMTDTISTLRRADTLSYSLIEEWSAELVTS
jgi:hypothetical protein